MPCRSPAPCALAPCSTAPPPPPAVLRMHRTSSSFSPCSCSSDASPSRGSHDLSSHACICHIFSSHVVPRTGSPTRGKFTTWVTACKVDLCGDNVPGCLLQCRQGRGWGRCATCWLEPQAKTAASRRRFYKIKQRALTVLLLLSAFPPAVLVGKLELPSNLREMCLLS